MLSCAYIILSNPKIRKICPNPSMRVRVALRTGTSLSLSSHFGWSKFCFLGLQSLKTVVFPLGNYSPVQFYLWFALRIRTRKTGNISCLIPLLSHLPFEYACLNSLCMASENTLYREFFFLAFLQEKCGIFCNFTCSSC